MAAQPAPDEDWIYRKRDGDPSLRVRVVSTHSHKQGYRATVEYLDGELAGQREDVSGRRLKGPWSDVKAYDQGAAGWQRLESYELSGPEKGATEYAFQLLLPNEVAMWGAGDGPVSAIYDRAGLQVLKGVSTDEVIERVDALDNEDDTVFVSGEGTRLIAEHACRRSPATMLNWLAADEQTIRQRCNGRSQPVGKDHANDRPVSPESEYAYYIEHTRPLHELLRQWCGHRAIEQHERLAAAEAEVHRLDRLLTRTIDTLVNAGSTSLAAALKREHEEERITPGTIRPTAERPLKRSEMPVRVEYRGRRWP